MIPNLVVEKNSKISKQLKRSKMIQLASHYAQVLGAGSAPQVGWEQTLTGINRCPDGCRRISALCQTVPLLSSALSGLMKVHWNWSRALGLFGWGAEFFRLSPKQMKLLTPGGVGRYNHFQAWRAFIGAQAHGACGAFTRRSAGNIRVWAGSKVSWAFHD